MISAGLTTFSLREVQEVVNPVETNILPLQEINKSKTGQQLGFAILSKRRTLIKHKTKLLLFT
jgi:hypothetical protein